MRMRDYGSFELCRRKRRINKSIPSSHNTFLEHAKLISSLPKYPHFSVRRTPRIEMLSDLSSEMKHVIANYEHVFWITYSWAGLKSRRFKAGDREEWDRERASKTDRLRERKTECVFALEQIISLGLTHALHKWEMMRRSPSHSFLAKFGASFTETGLDLCAIITTSSKHLQQGLFL